MTLFLVAIGGRWDIRRWFDFGDIFVAIWLAQCRITLVRCLAIKIGDCERRYHDHELDDEDTQPDGRRSLPRFGRGNNLGFFGVVFIGH